MALQYICSKFNYSVTTYHWPSLPPGYAYTETPTHGGKGVTFHITQERRPDGCPDGDSEAWNSLLVILLQIKACKPYRITVSGHGCSWFSYPIVSVTQDVFGGDPILNMTSPTWDVEELCEPPPEALEITPYGITNGQTNPTYIYTSTCQDYPYDGAIRIDVELYTGLCNNDQEVHIVVEPDV